MNKLLKFIVAAVVAVVCFAACDTDIEALQLQKPQVGTEEYYANLRAYKNSKHQLAFGWFGGWTASGAARSKYLSSVPDSVDLISIWGAWSNLTLAQIADLRYVQEVKGTKVMFTIFAHELPELYEQTDEGVQKYASDLCDSIVKYGYDGIDLDYEPGFGGKGYFINPENLNSTNLSVKGMYNMEVLCRALSERVGPASGTGKLFAIDGVPYKLNKGLAELFDYGIVQAYYCRSYTDLQGRFDNADNNGWKPEQYIFTEDFEKSWRTGGEADYIDEEGNVMPSLLGMARFQPNQGMKGGCGSYHMEYEYNHTDDEYKFLRQAIQIMNPAAH